ncbi:amicyanin [Mesorhizobium sp. M7A.F.Ca.US.006.01.1.1]|uniref:cupredoxin domain-containing protein n=1 Tax=Mesorhizobium sp. M7A.F.Ca.US.006.01.1.1 TaxID=2496707 RepID=UPI000FCC3780|nr:cupredoxin family copper-binding protein [Mesorhizobium sp. M7A.F.Ca.US.006.01.1.1]RUZ71634.1 amicyanin [Mesorhizobium sp. M7A.F.Ca.US.006.01.1.1]
MQKRRLWIALTLAVGTVPAQAETIQVIIDRLVFSPATVEAKIGDTIEWVNKDVFAHTASVKGGWEVMIPPKKSASLTLKTAGPVDYFCRFHPNMKGRLVVAP